MDWDTVLKNVQLVREGNDFMFKRSVECQAKYDEFKLEHKNIDIEEQYFKTTPFLYTVSPNLFPYDVGPNTKHFVLWGRPQQTTEDVVGQFAEHLCEWLNSIGYKSAWFINGPKYKSIPNVPHAHIFVNDA